ncbi:hypothetical protein [Actinomadura nitritigenes]|uniref:Uncharacterized protein n=1 Tax=Actinomadura nitritigenes TaxID=134602 RepID=A0ABS3R7A4_9ACTN|nr:hypothetical protein [Actinomadura nitritigenes]
MARSNMPAASGTTLMVFIDQTPVAALGEVRPHGSQIHLADFRALGVSLWGRMRLPHEVTSVDRVNDRLGAQ